MFFVFKIVQSWGTNTWQRYETMVRQCAQGHVYVHGCGWLRTLRAKCWDWLICEDWVGKSGQRQWDVFKKCLQQNDRITKTVLSSGCIRKQLISDMGEENLEYNHNSTQSHDPMIICELFVREPNTPVDQPETVVQTGDLWHLWSESDSQSQGRILKQLNTMGLIKLNYFQWYRCEDDLNNGKRRYS